MCLFPCIESEQIFWTSIQIRTWRQKNEKLALKLWYWGMYAVHRHDRAIRKWSFMKEKVVGVYHATQGKVDNFSSSSSLLMILIILLLMFTVVNSVGFQGGRGSRLSAPNAYLPPPTPFCFVAPGCMWPHPGPGHSGEIQWGQVGPALNYFGGSILRLYNTKWHLSTTFKIFVRYRTLI